MKLEYLVIIACTAIVSSSFTIVLIRYYDRAVADRYNGNQRDPEQRGDDGAGARMVPLMPPQPLRHEQSHRPGRRGDGEHLERVDSEDDQAGRNCRQQRDSGHQIIGQRGGSESCSIEQTAELDQPRSRRFGFEFAGPPGRHLGIVGKRAHLAVGLRVPGTRLG